MPLWGHKLLISAIFLGGMVVIGWVAKLAFAEWGWGFTFVGLAGLFIIGWLIDRHDARKKRETNLTDPRQ